MTNTKCDIYDKIKEDVLWIARHYWVFYIWPAILYFQFIAWVASPETTDAVISVAFTWATIDAMVRLRKYLTK